MPSVKKRGGLGRGLNALVSEAEYETGGSAASASNAASETKLPIEDIVPNPNQPRIHFNETELRELSESIQEHGVLQPLLVRKHGNGYEIIAGERRYQASKLAGLEELPVIIKDVNDEEMLALALIENLQRSDLNPVEEAKGYRQLIDASGMTHRLSPIAPHEQARKGQPLMAAHAKAARAIHFYPRRYPQSPAPQRPWGVFCCTCP